jgi:hypothetical protein
MAGKIQKGGVNAYLVCGFVDSGNAGFFPFPISGIG